MLVPKTSNRLISYGRRMAVSQRMAIDLIALKITNLIKAGRCYAPEDLHQIGFSPEVISALYEDALATSEIDSLRAKAWQCDAA